MTGERGSPRSEALDALLGVYALDAIDDPAERAAVEAYLDANADAAAEVQSYREALSYLPPGAPAPPELWARIEAQLSDVPPPLQLDRLTRPTVRRRVRRRGTRPVHKWIAAAAAAFVIAASAAAIASAARGRDGDSIAQEATAAERRAGAQRIEMRDPSGALRIGAVAEPDGDLYVRAEALPRLASGRTYQVWCVREPAPISLGIIGAAPETVKLYVDACRGAIAITNEAAGGGASPSGAPVVAGTFV